MHVRLHVLPTDTTSASDLGAGRSDSAQHVAAALFDARNHVPHRFKKVSELYQPSIDPEFNESFDFDLAEVWHDRSTLSLYVVLLARTDAAPTGLACLGCTAIPLTMIERILKMHVDGHQPHRFALYGKADGLRSALLLDTPPPLEGRAAEEARLLTRLAAELERDQAAWAQAQQRRAAAVRLERERRRAQHATHAELAALATAREREAVEGAQARAAQRAEAEQRAEAAQLQADRARREAACDRARREAEAAEQRLVDAERVLRDERARATAATEQRAADQERRARERRLAMAERMAREAREHVVMDVERREFRRVAEQKAWEMERAARQRARDAEDARAREAELRAQEADGKSRAQQHRAERRASLLTEAVAAERPGAFQLARPLRLVAAPAPAEDADAEAIAWRL